jgi:hypothetical protein
MPSDGVPATPYRDGQVDLPCMLDGGNDIGHVQRERSIRPPLNRPGGQLEVAVRLRQPCPQVMHQLPQVRAGLTVGRIWPQ